MEKIIKKTMLLYTFFFLAFSNSFANEKANSFGSEKEAKEMLERAIRIVESNLTVTCHDKRWPGGFHVKDLYPFCVDNKGIMHCASNTCKDMSNFVSSDGVKVAQLMLRLTHYQKFHTS